MIDSSRRNLSGHITSSQDAIVQGMELVAARFEKNPAYPYVNAKLNLLDGMDFPESSDPESDFKGLSAVFGWIQGRSLEALAGHADYFGPSNPLTARLDRVLEKVGAQIHSIYKKNGGHFSFLFTPDGRSFRMDSRGKREFFDPSTLPPGFSALFCAKGLVAAGVRLNRPDWIQAGKETFRQTARAILEYRFATDQISFDVRNPVVVHPQKRPQGPWMIALGAWALFEKSFPDENEWSAQGQEALRHVMDLHVVKTKGESLQPFDFLEWVDEKGRPWRENDRVICDSGHALEFTGLAAKLLLAMKDHRPIESRAFIESCGQVLPHVFLQAFQQGFQPRVGGICKTYDLVSRSPLNDDMPWWSLPEAMRAGALLCQLYPQHLLQGEILVAVEKCAAALFEKYRSPVPGFFVQTRNSQGEAVATIPATPDADPGYHTGLCLIDFVNAIKAL